MDLVPNGYAAPYSLFIPFTIFRLLGTILYSHLSISLSVCQVTILVTKALRRCTRLAFRLVNFAITISAADQLNRDHDTSRRLGQESRRLEGHFRSGPVPELFRSFNRILCLKGETTWQYNIQQNLDRKRCALH